MRVYTKDIPFDITFTIESQRDADALYALFNFVPVMEFFKSQGVPSYVIQDFTNYLHRRCDCSGIYNLKDYIMGSTKC